jgi:hypothetical protein
MDFIHDQLATGRRFRCLTLVDDFTRQCLAIHVDTSIGGASVVAVLQRLASPYNEKRYLTGSRFSRVQDPDGFVREGEKAYKAGERTQVTRTIGPRVLD